MAQAEPIVFFNGELKPESQVGISIRDRGYLYGDAVFDAARTFNGTPFRLPEHVHRLYDSLRYLRIDPMMDPREMEDWSRQVVKHNYELLPPGQDMWVMQRISRGVEPIHPGDEMRATVLIETTPSHLPAGPLYTGMARTLSLPLCPGFPPGSSAHGPRPTTI